MNHSNLLLLWSVNQTAWKMPLVKTAKFFGLLRFRIVRYLLDIREDRLASKISEYTAQHFDEMESLKQTYTQLLVRSWKIKTNEQVKKDWNSIVLSFSRDKINKDNFWTFVTNSTESEIFVPFLQQSLPTFMLRKLKDNAIPLDKLISDSFVLQVGNQQITLNGFQWHFLTLESEFFRSIKDNPNLEENQNNSTEIQIFSLEDLQEFFSHVWREKPKIDKSNALKILQISSFFDYSRFNNFVLNDYLAHEEDFNQILELAKGVQNEHDNFKTILNFIKTTIEKVPDKQTFLSYIQACKEKQIFCDELDLTSKRLIDDDCLISLAGCPLKKLNLSKCRNFSEKGIAALSTCQTLEHLDLSGSSITDAGIRLIVDLSTLHSLNLEESNVTDEALTMLTKLKSLQCLNLSSCSKITHSGLSALANFKSLLELHLDWLDIADEQLDFIVHLEFLENLSLKGDKLLTDKGLSKLTELQSLQCLDLSHCINFEAGDRYNFTDNGLKCLAKLKFLRHLNLDLSAQNMTDETLASFKELHLLQYLSLGWAGNISDNGVASLANLQFLEYLNFSQTKITDQGVSSLVNLPQLKILDLSSCNQITDKVFPSIAKLKSLNCLKMEHCKITDEGLPCLLDLPLEHLDLRECHQITDQGMASLKQKKSLCSLDLLWCEQITDQGIALLADLPLLTELYLGDRINGKGLAPFASHQSLTSLYLDSTQIDDEVLKLLATFPSLKSLKLNNCSITDQGLEFLSFSRSLLRLYFNCCRNITDKGLLKLARSPKLNYLSIIGAQKITSNGKAMLKTLKPNLNLLVN